MMARTASPSSGESAPSERGEPASTARSGVSERAWPSPWATRTERPAPVSTPVTGTATQIWNRLPLPRFLFGGAEAREWEEPDGGLALSLTLRHPWFGPLAGYEAVMKEVRSP